MRAIVAAALLLSGCAAPEIRYVTKEVKVPVRVVCQVEQPAPRKWALKEENPDSDIFIKVRAALAELRQREAYETELVAALGACTKDP